MSGTSLDGVDLALCEFEKTDGKWRYQLLAARTIGYPDQWKERLSSASSLDGYALSLLDREYGQYLGTLVKNLVDETGMRPDLAASHGHTIYHRPDLGLTLQIGSGPALGAAASLPVVCDFRSMDVALGGQGAPLVPVGDALLFSSYEYCLNLGGFANISYDLRGRRIAHDISPCNLALNYLAGLEGKDYDDNGHLAEEGEVLDDLLLSLNRLSFYELPPPKSLGREWFESVFLPLLQPCSGEVRHCLRTVTEHIAQQVAASLQSGQRGTLLATGGGAHNKFLLERIRKLSGEKVEVPDSLLVDFKEAVVFAFLGVLRWYGEINVLSSVTGSEKDHCGGSIWMK